jgi:hypothetical protein
VGNGKILGGGLVYSQRSSDEISNYQMGNETGSIDLIDYQVGNRKFPSCQVGREKEVRLSESLRSSKVSSCQRGVLIDGDSCGLEDHVNEDGDKLKTFTIHEEDQRSILIIGGIKIFLLNSQVEASAHDESATKEEGHLAVTVIEEEDKEQTLAFSPTEGEEHSAELLKIFSQEDEQEMTTALELAAEEEADKMDFIDLYEEPKSLERRVMVKILHIQQVKLDTDGGAYQPEE